MKELIKELKWRKSDTSFYGASAFLLVGFGLMCVCIIYGIAGILRLI